MTAEEAFAKACHGIFVSEQDVIAWATNHGVIQGANLPQVMELMQNDGFSDNTKTYNDGPYYTVAWTDSDTLQSAISSTGPVKLGVAGNQLETARRSAGSSDFNTWFGTGFQLDENREPLR